MKPIIITLFLRLSRNAPLNVFTQGAPILLRTHQNVHFFRLSVTLEEIRNFEPATKIVTTPWTPCTFVTFDRDPNRTKNAQKSWSDTLHTYNRKTITVTVRVTAKNGRNKVTNSVLLLFLKRPKPIHEYNRLNNNHETTKKNS